MVAFPLAYRFLSTYQADLPLSAFGVLLLLIYLYTIGTDQLLTLIGISATDPRAPLVPAFLFITVGLVGFLGQTSVWILLLLVATLAGSHFLGKKEAVYPAEQRPWWQLPLSVALCVYLYTLYYGSNPVTFTFEQAFILDTNYAQDTAWHAAIAEAIRLRSLPSVGIDGDIYLTYHWLSHALVAGWSNLCGVRSLSFYHLFLPVLLLIVNLKAWHGLCRDYGHQVLKKTFPFVAFLICLLIFYALPLHITQGVTQPFTSESFSASLYLFILLLQLLLRSSTTERADWRVAHSVQLILGGGILVLAICFMKISTGALALALVGVFALKHLPLKKVILVGAVLAVITLITLYYVYPIGRTARTASIGARYNVLFSIHGGLFFLGMPVLAAFVLAGKDAFTTVFRTLKKTTYRGDYLFMLVTLYLVAGALSIYVSANDSDVLFFLFPIFLLSVLPLLVHAYEAVIRRQLLTAYWTFALISAITLSYTAGEYFFRSTTRELLPEPNIIDRKSSLRRQLLRAVDQHNATEPTPEQRTSTLVYVPPSELWYYRTNKEWTFLPGVTIWSHFELSSRLGYALLSGLPDNWLNSDFGDYGILPYKERAEGPQIATKTAAITTAKNRGYKTLIYIASTPEDELIWEEIDL